MQQADPGAGHAAGRAASSTASCSRWPARRTRVRPSTSTGYAASSPAPGSTRTRCRPRRTTRSTTRPARSCIRARRRAASIAMNCSGKHAAMLATCVANGWDTATYLEPEHPLQEAIATTFAELTGEPVETSRSTAAVRRCCRRRWSGWPGRSARWRRATEGPERRVADAIRRLPGVTSGTRRDEARAAAGGPRLDRQGRGGVLLRRRRCADGRAVALKTDDGAPAGAPGADGRCAGAHGGARRAGRRRGRRTADRGGRAARRAAGGSARSAPALPRSDYDGVVRPGGSGPASTRCPRRTRASDLPTVRCDLVVATVKKWLFSPGFASVPPDASPMFRSAGRKGPRFPGYDDSRFPIALIKTR